MTSRNILRPRTLPMVFGVFLLLALSVGVVSAQTDDENAQIRVVHAAPDAGNVDVYVDGELAIPDLAYMDATDFQPLPDGDHDIQVTTAGGPVEDAVIDTSVSVTGGDTYTFVAHGTADGADLLEVTHDWDEPGEDMASVVVVNATSDEASVEVQYGDDGTAIGDGAVDLGSVTSAEVEPGDYSFEVLVNGESAATLDGFTVEAGTTYSMFVMGTEGSYEVVPYEDMLAQAPGGEETPETDMTGTPEGDETPEADMTGTPEEDETPEADMTGTPEADETPDADMTGTPEEDETPDADATGTPEADETPEADTTPETAMTGTPGTGSGVPEVPATGAGGMAGESGASGWIALAIAALAVALGGGLVWRSRNERAA